MRQKFDSWRRWRNCNKQFRNDRAGKDVEILGIGKSGFEAAATEAGGREDGGNTTFKSHL